MKPLNPGLMGQHHGNRTHLNLDDVLARREQLLAEVPTAARSVELRKIRRQVERLTHFRSPRNGG
jgi:hypothetical protein